MKGGVAARQRYEGTFQEQNQGSFADCPGGGFMS
jgi:hypothetical protein